MEDRDAIHEASPHDENQQSYDRPLGLVAVQYRVPVCQGKHSEDAYADACPPMESPRAIGKDGSNGSLYGNTNCAEEAPLL